MSDDSTPVIAKKIESARRVSTPIPRLNEVLGELTKRIEKQVRGYVGTVVEAMILDVETKVFSDVLDSMSMPAMIGMVEAVGHANDRVAIVNMDLDLVYHLVDLRMGGSPAEYPEFGARRPTSIDSALCMPVVDMALKGFTQGIVNVFGVEESLQMHCTGFEHLPMLASIVHEKSDVLCVKVSLDIGEAARSGDFELVLPFSTIDMIKSQLKQAANVSNSSANDAWASHMLNVVLETEIELTPVVFTTQMLVAEIARFEVGAVIELDAGAHQAVELTLDTPNAPLTLATARLGALKRQKALKLTTDPDPTFTGPLRALAATAHPS